jgi:hypothetical protein
MVEEGRELGWDEEIETPDEGDFVVFPNGIYPFVIHHIERGRHTGSTKLPPCNMVTVHIEFDGGELLGTNTVKHKLFLHTKTTGLLSQYFRGTGLRKHGDPLVLDWNATVGKRGYAQLGIREYEGKEYQDIKKFIDPEDWPTPPMQTQQPANPDAPF